MILRVLEKKHERLGPNVSITECTVLDSSDVAADVIYKTIRWIRMLSTEEEEEYGEDLNFEIEQAYQKKDGVFKCEEDGFYIDFTKMEEKDTVTDKVVKVKCMDLIQGKFIYVPYIVNLSAHSCCRR